MSNKKKGDILEWMVYILEQSLSTTPSTIHRNYRLPDQHGVSREIDIYVEAFVNGKTLKYAFECKNHKNGIQLSHIADFHSKIANKGMKGFFVTTSNYQSGAIEKANAVEIELMSLKKREANPEDIKGLVFIQKKYRITTIQILGNTDPGAVINNDDLIQNCPQCTRRMVEIVEQDAIPFLQQRIDAGIEVLHPEYADIRNIGLTVGEGKAKEMVALVNFEGASITHKGLQIHYDWMQLGLKVWHEVFQKEPGNRNMYSYLGNGSNDILASFSMNEFLLHDQNLIVGIATLNDGRRKLTMTSSIKEKSEMHEMISLGTIDELGIREALEGKTPDDC